MSMNVFQKKWDPEQGHGIMDHHFLAMKSAERFARETKSARIASWVSAGVTMVAAIAAVIALFKS